MSTSCDAYKSSPVNWELSLYDLHRTPQPLIEDDTEIAILPSTLNSELKCPICLDLLRNTMTTKECLHRFCQECIITALRAGNKECPTCRKKLVSKRSLRHDPNFDELISKIFPCREEYEAAQDDKWTKISSKTLANVSGTVNASFQKRRSSGIASRYSIRKSAKVNKGEDEDKKLCTDATTYPVGAGDVVMNSTPLSQGSEEVEQQQQIQMIFKPLNATTTEVLTSVQRYLKTTPNALIEHLSMFIAMRMRIESQEEEQPSSTNVRNDHQQAEDALKDVLQRTSKQSENTSAYRIYVYCSKENTQVLLDPSQLLGSVYAQYNVNQEPLQMFYAAVGSDESKMSLPSPTTHLQHHGKDKKKR